MLAIPIRIGAGNARQALLGLAREELDRAVEVYGKDVESPARIDYIDAILQSVGGYESLLREETEQHKRLLDERAARGELPEQDDEVWLRQGAWLVTDVHRGGDELEEELPIFLHRWYFNWLSLGTWHDAQAYAESKLDAEKMRRAKTRC